MLDHAFILSDYLGICSESHCIFNFSCSGRRHIQAKAAITLHGCYILYPAIQREVIVLLLVSICRQYQCQLSRITCILFSGWLRNSCCLDLNLFLFVRLFYVISIISVVKIVLKRLSCSIDRCIDGSFLTRSPSLICSVIMLLSDMSGRSPLYRKYVKDIYFWYFCLHERFDIVLGFESISFVFVKGICFLQFAYFKRTG